MWTVDRTAPRTVTAPPGKLGFTVKKYCNEFIVTDVADECTVRVRRGESIVSVDGHDLTSLEELPQDSDNSRTIGIGERIISNDASAHSKGQLMFLKEIGCALFEIMDYTGVEAKYGKEFVEELAPPHRKTGNQILSEALNVLSNYDFGEDDDDPLEFDTIFAPHECKYLLEDEKNIIFCMAEEENNDDLPTAISGKVMYEGKHYCTIKVTDNKEPCIIAGICRSMENLDREFAFAYGDKTMCPLYNVSTYAQWDSDCHACAYNAATGEKSCVGWDTKKDDPKDQLKYPEISKWEGMETLPPGSVLGLLLDLEEGTLTVYKDNRRLGVIKEGLEGSFCWFVGTFHPCQVEINRGPVPKE